ncbi:MAG: CHRD domain-containing protein [Planctomycetota bacterium]
MSSTALAATTNISAIINAGQENPAPAGVAASAAGFASLSYDDVTSELSWNVSWQDLTGTPVGMHIHAAAAPGNNAGVGLNIGDLSGLTSPSIGSAVIDAGLASDIMSGLSYINIHTSANGPGEIRGQVKPTNQNLVSSLDASQEVDPPTGVPADAHGAARIAYDPDTNMLGWHIEWSDLTGPAVGLHFHGAAGPGQNAGVLLNVGDISGLSSPSIGTAIISDDFANDLLGGLSYINVHTAMNPGGEIRGQVVPEPSSLMLAASCLGLLFAIRRQS